MIAWYDYTVSKLHSLKVKQSFTDRVQLTKQHYLSI